MPVLTDTRPAVLFVRADSVYKDLDCDPWDAARDARNFPGGSPVVAHPPCRGWGQLRGLSHATAEEKALGPFAVAQVRQWGGVLEHPQLSSLWRACDLPRPGAGRDAFGGYTIAAPQWWFGHRAAKWTWFYIVGCEPADLPAIPYKLGRAPRVIANRKGIRAGHPDFRTECTKAEREHTPPALAAWLIEVALRCAR